MTDFGAKNIFHKYSGAENTFLLTWTSFWKMEADQRNKFVIRLCSPLTGLNVDGLVGLEPIANSKSEFRWHFYNADGSLAEMCGNAARCVSQFLLAEFPDQKEIQLHTKNGPLWGTGWGKNQIEVKFSTPIRQVECNGHAVVWSGVPHLLVAASQSEFESETGRMNLRARARDLRGLNPFTETVGTNVTFFEKRKDKKYFAVTFERGVEDFTQACGTGAIAVAHFVSGDKPDSERKNTSVEMPGGWLEVEFKDGFTYLRGDAIHHFSADLVLPALTTSQKEDAK